MKKICENCKKTISKNEWYFEVNEFQKGKIFGTKYVHKICQDLFNQKINKANFQGLQIAGKLMNQAKGMMKQLGFEPQEVVKLE